MSELTLGSLFDGIAGFPLSASRHGITTKWGSEIEAFPIKVTEKHFPDMEHLGDVTKMNGALIEPVDIISFGSPCQDMSVAGKQEGLGGARSGLFMEAVRIIKEMREATNGTYPRFAIWENVPGAFSSNKGNDFRAVLEEITEAEIPIPFSGRWAEAGMVRGNGREVAWRVLDAQYWGVPQRRKRIFLVADLAGQCAGEILFEREGLPGNIAESGEEGEEIAASVRDGIETTSGIGFAMQAIGEYSDTDKASTLKQRDYKDATDLVVCHSMILENHPADSRVKVDESGTVQTLTSRMGTGGGNVPMLIQPITCATKQLSQNIGYDVAMPLMESDYKESQAACQPTYCLQGNMIGREDKNGPQGTGINEDVSFTLNATDRHAVVHATGYTNTGYSKYTEGVGVLKASGGDAGGGSETLIAHAVDVRNLCETEDLSGTLQAKNTGGYSLNYQNPIRIGYRVRRLTPTETLRLQGFPDNWLDIEGASDSAKYKAVGNSVAIPCPDFIFERIVKVLRRKL